MTVSSGLHWFHTAGALLRRQQLYALTIILTLGLTLGALVATFNLNYQLFITPLPYPDAERLHLVRGSQWQQDKQVAAEWLPAQGQLDIYRQDWPEVATKALHNIGIDVAQNLPGNPSFNIGYITPEYLPMFDAPLALGRHFSRHEGLDRQVPVAVLAYQVWQQHFAGDPDVLGKTVQFRGVSFKVVGVLAGHFVEPVMAAPGWSTDVWLSYDFNDVGKPNWSFNSNQIHLLLKLKADAKPQQLAHSFEQWAAPEFAAANQTNAFLKNSSVRWHLEPVQERILGDAARLSLSLLAGSLLLCAIAVANIANLVLSRAMAQQRSLTIRIALGARQQDLFRQFFTEFSVLALPAFALCLLIATAGLHSLKAGYAGPLPRLQELNLSIISIWFAFGSLLMICLTLAVWLTRQLNYHQLQQNLQQSGKGSAMQVSSHTRRLLLMSQTLFCLLTLIYCSQIFMQALSKLQRPSGLDLQTYQVALNPGSLLQQMNAAQRIQLIKQARDQVKTDSNALIAGLGDYPPISYWLAGFGLSTVSTSQTADSPALTTDLYFGDEAYLQALGLNLRQGTFYSRSQVQGKEAVVVISQSLANKISATGQVLDKQLYLRGSDQPSRIIGVVNDLHLPNQPEQAALYGAVVPSAFPFLLIKMPAGTRLSRAQVNQSLAKVHPQLKVYKFNTTAEILTEHTKDARVAAVVTAALSVLALTLAGLGIFAIIRTQMQLRQYELAVRQALGATPARLLQLTLYDNAKPLFATLGLLILAYLALHLIQRAGHWPALTTTLAVAPVYVMSAMLTVLLLTTAIVLTCLQQVLRQPVVHTLRGLTN